MADDIDQETPTREELIALCEAAVVPMDRWYDRDTGRSQEGIGRAWALLRAGCPFTVSTAPSFKGDGCVTDDDMIWIEIVWRGFNAFEIGDEGMSKDTFYIPTAKRLAKADGHDWY